MPDPSSISDFDLAANLAAVESMRQSLGLARAFVGRGRSVELEGVQGGVGLICAKALDLPPEHARALRVALLALRDEVDCLSAALRSERPDT